MPGYISSSFRIAPIFLLFGCISHNTQINYLDCKVGRQEAKEELGL